ncbi:3',5'-cyclic-nucleotide phosphodiesterase [Blastomyces dermatitidis ER-3]|uniref:3',5'-cyclic-nucleotide phosphodiesterase n=3 Tax=Ajellomyces dermatitidis TaxID=5039 RepID=F2TCB6_AJEDA|nr:3',5'-cyclic-nucleotide phosphodiesterase [Blastomyces dermatitidis ER-3]EEQ89844.1 3',5'-cyclic-nucleotide phosphodiesterase [Blastomyces dermatitidis ER-3]EGE80879.1 3',5'-cyclic-nucleotide phosphodiesterase [Blastomyces dermatitidis ATCC 18188]
MHRNGGQGQRARRGQSSEAQRKSSFHVIVLGSSGGPREDIVSALLVRSTATNWSAGSVIAIDAGTLLGGIIRALENSSSAKDEKSTDVKLRMTEGPFAGLELPNTTTGANAAYIFREIISSVFITHPHLDHLAGLAMNTPLVEAQSNPKIVAALPPTIAAIKNHIFNDITWPNLSDEDGGAGLITYHRLVDGGNPRLGRAEGRGYIRACEGILAKCLSVSHGRCAQRYHPETGQYHRAESTVFTTESGCLPSRRVSIDTQDLARSYTPNHQAPCAVSSSGKASSLASVESSAFFLRDDYSGAEIIVFGDIEPDSISLDPRNEKVWEIAAPKVANGSLRAIFIECSYMDCVEDSSLYGHLCPRHLIAELQVLAAKVSRATDPEFSDTASRKRKHATASDPILNEPTSPKSTPPRSQSRRTSSSSRSRWRTTRFSGSRHHAPAEAVKPDDAQPTTPPGSGTPMGDDDDDDDHDDHAYDENGYDANDEVGVEKSRDTPEISSHHKPAKRTRSAMDRGRKPLAGLRVYIIHVKDSLTDGLSPREVILDELRAHNEDAALGCEFYAPLSGEEVFI